MALSAGTRLGPYEIFTPLGAGGMGEVYKARDTKLHRDVALKVLLPSVANDPDRLARFSREAQVLASLNHPNIAQIYGLEDSGTLALFADYAGDFATAEREVRALKNPDAHGIAALALSQLGQGLLHEAAETYRKLGTMDAWGASFAASGLGDIALYQGRFSDASRILEQGAAEDLQRKNADNAAMKYAAVAYAHLGRRQMAAAIAAADEALLNSKAVPIRFLTARVFVEAGAIAKAASLASLRAASRAPGLRQDR